MEIRVQFWCVILNLAFVAEYFYISTSYRWSTNVIVTIQFNISIGLSCDWDSFNRYSVQGNCKNLFLLVYIVFIHITLVDFLWYDCPAQMFIIKYFSWKIVGLIFSLHYKKWGYPSIFKNVGIALKSAGIGIALKSARIGKNAYPDAFFPSACNRRVMTIGIGSSDLYQHFSKAPG